MGECCSRCCECLSECIELNAAAAGGEERRKQCKRAERKAFQDCQHVYSPMSKSELEVALGDKLYSGKLEVLRDFEEKFAVARQQHERIERERRQEQERIERERRQEQERIERERRQEQERIERERQEQERIERERRAERGHQDAARPIFEADEEEAPAAEEESWRGKRRALARDHPDNSHWSFVPASQLGHMLHSGSPYVYEFVGILSQTATLIPWSEFVGEEYYQVFIRCSNQNGQWGHGVFGVRKEYDYGENTKGWYASVPPEFSACDADADTFVRAVAVKIPTLIMVHRDNFNNYYGFVNTALLMKRQEKVY